MILRKRTHLPALVAAAALFASTSDTATAQDAVASPPTPPANSTSDADADATATDAAAGAEAASLLDALGVILRCVNVTSVELYDECECGDLASTCSFVEGAAAFLGPIVGGLDGFCDASATCCAADGSVANAAYNACLEENGATLPDLLVGSLAELEATDAPTTSAPVTAYPTYSPITDFPTYSPITAEGPNATLSGPCFRLITRIITEGPDPDAESDEMELADACCKNSEDGEALLHPYCDTLTCVEEEVGGITDSCDCDKGMEYYDITLPEWPRLPMERCCPPGESFAEFDKCFHEKGYLTNPPALCETDPTADACTCLGDDALLDMNCDCGAMRDLYGEDALWGLAWGLMGDASDAALLESCCASGGGVSVQDATSCIEEGWAEPTPSPTTDSLVPPVGDDDAVTSEPEATGAPTAAPGVRRRHYD